MMGERKKGVKPEKKERRSCAPPIRTAVCMKQVPENAEKSVTGDGKIRRDGRFSVINPSDVFALEAGLTIKEKRGGAVDVFTMGTEAAKALLDEAGALGADGLFLLSDPDFAGADTYATAHVLAAALRMSGPYDLILCGRRTQDGETGQVPAEMAVMMGLPAVTNVVAIEDAGEGRLRFRRMLEYCEETVEAALPAVVGVMEGMEGIGHPRFPSLQSMQHAGGRSVVCLGRADLDLPREQVGSSGSFTEVRRIFFPDWKRSCRFCSVEEGIELIRKSVGKAEEKSEPK